MIRKKTPHNRLPWLSFMAMLLPANLLAYTGGETFLHYTKVPEASVMQYQAVCKSLVLSDTSSDTLKNARAEFDLAIPKMLGGGTLQLADGSGAIVLAEQGSEPVASANIDYSNVDAEGFIVKSAGGKTYISGKTQVGVLRGTFFFLRLMQMGKDIGSLDTTENPYFAYRVLDHWYNHYNSEYEADRLYGGSRVFKMEDFGKLKEIPDEYTRVITYCRMAAALGLNGITPDCVNTYQSGKNKNHVCLDADTLKKEKVFADIIGTYGLKYYLSVSYASPLIINPKINSSDAYKNAAAKKWWFDKVDTVRTYIKNFGGFLMKADSEGEDGPTTLGETQSQGANPIAEALGRYGLILIWRTFIYGTNDPDFAVNQGKSFAKPAQTWDSAVVIRMKDGTHDFQPIEPPHQLLAMPGARLGMEFQITQEYTGQGIHLDWLVPRWKKTLEWNIKGASNWNGAAGTITHQIIKGAGSRKGGVWAISNLSDTVNWTGHFFHQANYFGWGRLAWNPTLSADEIADEWIRCSFDNGDNPIVQKVVREMLMRSWPAYKDYVISHNASMSQIGNNNHYEVDFAGMKNINFFNEWLMNFTSNGIGVERCGKSTGGTVSNNFANDYLTADVASVFNDPATCPEEYMLFFHHYKWEWVMKGGMTLIQQLNFEHFNGIHQVQKWIKYWKQLNSSNFFSPLIDPTIHDHVLAKLDQQLKDGSRWADNFRRDFGASTVYTKQVPCHIDMITPDTTKAVEIAVDGKVELSVRLRTQNGTAVNDGTFNWSVEGGGATLSATSGATTTFSANTPGIFTVKVWDSRWPAQFEDELIFVGTSTGAQKMRETALPVDLKVFQSPHGIVIHSSIAGKIRLVNLQGKTVRTLTIDKPGSVVLETRGFAKGFYMLQMTDGTQSLCRHGVFVQ